MRWGYLIPRLVAVAIFWAFFAFGFDPALRYGLVTTIQTSSGRPVRIQAIETSFWPPRLQVAGLQVSEADRLDRSEFEVGTADLTLSKSALKQRRFVVEEIRLSDVRWNVPADYEALPTEQGEAERPESQWMRSLTSRASDAVNEMVGSLELSARDAIDPDRLETVRVGRLKEANYRSLATRLEAEVATLRSRGKWLEAEGNRIKDDPASYLDPAKIESLVREGTAVRDQIRYLKSQLIALRTRIPSDLADLKAAKDRDIARTKATLAELRAEPGKLTEAFLGEPVARAIDHIMTWAPRVSRLRESSDWDSVEVERHRGREIDFLNLPEQPFVALNRCLVSGAAIRDGAEWPFQAELGDIVAAPRSMRRPVAFRWANGGVPTVQAVGSLMVGEDQTGVGHATGLTAHYHIHDPTAFEAATRGRAVAHVSAAGQLLDGTITLTGDEVRGAFNVTFDGLAANITSERESLAPLLDMIRIDPSPLTASVEFAFDPSTRRPACRVRCDEFGALLDDLKTRRGELAAAGLAAARVETEAVASRYITDWSQQLDETLAKYDLETTELLGHIELARTLLQNPSAERIQQVAAEKLQEHLPAEYADVTAQVMESGLLTSFPKPGQPLSESTAQTLRTAAALPVAQEATKKLTNKAADRVAGELNDLFAAEPDLRRIAGAVGGKGGVTPNQPLLQTARGLLTPSAASRRPAGQGGEPAPNPIQAIGGGLLQRAQPATVRNIWGTSEPDGSQPEEQKPPQRPFSGLFR